MRRTTALTATTLLGLALLSPTTVSAAGETCRGETATIVGAPETRLVGTEGRDVVVTGGSSHVSTLGGDDVVCVTTPADLSDGAVGIHTGAGNDVLDTTTSGSSIVSAVLGSGADRYEGGDAGALVVAGEADLDRLHEGPPAVPLDTEADVLVGGAGEDRLYSGQQGVPNPDTVLGGAGEDTISHIGPQQPPGLVDGGPGTDDLVVPLPAGHTHVDASGRTMVVPGGGVAWTAIEIFTFEAEDPAARRLTFRGTAGEDQLTVRVQEGLTLMADLGRGNDVLTVLAVPRDGDVDGGRGRDVLLVSTDSGSVHLDLRTGLLESEAEGISGSLSVSGFEPVAVAARRVRLTGTEGPDYLVAEACRAVVRGRGGSDLVERSGGSDIGRGGGPCRNRALLDGGAGADYITSVGRSRDRILGGSGHDSLDGQRGPDRITGGPGRDRADGGPGPRPDTCRAEREVRCER